VLAALEHTRAILTSIPPEIIEIFETVVHSFLQALAGNVITSNKGVSESALLTIDVFISTLPAALLCPALVSLAEHHGSARARLAILKKVVAPELSFLRGVYDTKPIMIRKYVVPLAARLLVVDTSIVNSLCSSKKQSQLASTIWTSSHGSSNTSSNTPSGKGTSEVAATARLLVLSLRSLVGDRTLLDMLSMTAELPRVAHDAFRAAVLGGNSVRSEIAVTKTNARNRIAR
jgi:hypothetical protein